MVRVQKSKEDGLDFSLALSFYLLFKISKSEAQEISGPLSRVAIVFGGKRCGAVVLFSRDKKKKRKKKIMRKKKLMSEQRCCCRLVPADVDCT